MDEVNREDRRGREAESESHIRDANVRMFCEAKSSENEIITKAKQGHQASLDAILEKYKPLAKSKAKEYFIISGDPEDLIQEGMIGLYKAVLGFDQALGKQFTTFAAICIERQIQSAVKASLRQKHIPLNTSISLDWQMDSQDAEEGQAIHEKLVDNKAHDPETVLLGQETARLIGEAIQGLLSKLELVTLGLYMEGRAISEISDVLGISKKSVDNALQRVKRKIGRIIFSGTGKASRRNNGRQQKNAVIDGSGVKSTSYR